jgi:hypothetical protein
MRSIFFIENKGTIFTHSTGNYLIESTLAVLEQELAAKVL